MATEELVNRLSVCPKGKKGWREFEDVCIDILRFLFVPPLRNPRIQPRTLSGTERRDAIFANRNMDTSNIWGQLRAELNARFIVFEFKNYKKQKLTATEVDQLRNYLTGTIGNLGIICSTQPPSKTALKRRNTVFTREEKVILFLTSDDMKEMVYIKERGEDPADLIMDMVEEFYLQHE
jgi:hypothetical protein